MRHLGSVLSVTKWKLTVMGGALALGAAVALPITSANAYPPGTTLALTATPDPHNPTLYTVIVTNGQPGCQLKISVHGHDEYGRIGSDGTSTRLMVVGPISGPYTITAQVYGFRHGGDRCGPAENAAVNVVVTKYKLLGPTSVRAGDTFQVQATGWLPSTDTLFTISDGNTLLTFPTRTGPDGRVTQTVSVPRAGTWAVVVTQPGGPTKSYSLHVLPRHKDKHADAGHGHKPPAPKPAPKPKHPTSHHTRHHTTHHTKHHTTHHTTTKGSTPGHH